MSEHGAMMHAAESVRSVGDLVARMALTLQPSLGDAALGDARELFALLHAQPRHWAVLHGDQPISSEDVVRAMQAASRRAAGAPMEYAAGRAAFRHLLLHVDERVLIPRPETELLVGIVLELARMSPGGIAVDVGAGSGAITLSLAGEGAFEHVIGTDISLDALAVARDNALRCGPIGGARIDFRHGSLLGPVRERGLRVVVSNPPYIAFEEAAALPAAVRNWEPTVALFSGANGMDATARLVREAAAALMPRGVLALEVDTRRASTAAELVATHGAFEEVRVMLDLTGRERFVVARRLEERG